LIVVLSSLFEIPEASTGFEPVMRVLQTLALPLGHDAVNNLLIEIADHHYNPQSSISILTGFLGYYRAGDGIRTHDLLLGKETFYH
jgi:hypothetical protein